MLITMRITYFLAFIVLFFVWSCDAKKDKSEETKGDTALTEESTDTEKTAGHSWIDDSEMDVLSNTWVAEDDKGVVSGCCALQVIWSDLAEVKSLAVQENSTGRGVGRALVEAAIKAASDLGLEEVFTLTLEPGFFEKLRFERISKERLPMKVWSDCAKCPKQDNCDEIAMVYTAK